MAINKKLIHFKTFANFNSQKLSANEANTKYTTGISGTETSGNPDILYQSICFIKDTQQIWTHGQIYNASTDGGGEIPTKLSELENDSGFITSDGTSAKANQLTTTRFINGVPFNGTTNVNNFVSCSTAAATAAKTVTIDGFRLLSGAQVRVKFTNANTASSPTLNVSSTGAKPIYYNGLYSTSFTSTSFPFDVDKIYTFTYDGTYWRLEGDWLNTVTATSTSANYPLILGPSASDGGSLSSGDKMLYSDSVNSAYYNPSTNVLTAPYLSGISASTFSTSLLTCSTAAATAAKTISASGFKLTTGVQVRVKFTYANTATSPTLNINSTGAKSMRYNGVTVTSSNFTFTTSDTYEMTYDGTYWVISDMSVDTDLIFLEDESPDFSGVSDKILKFEHGTRISVVFPGTVGVYQPMISITDKTGNGENKYLYYKGFDANGVVEANKIYTIVLDKSDPDETKWLLEGDHDIKNNSFVQLSAKNSAGLYGTVHGFLTPGCYIYGVIGSPIATCTASHVMSLNDGVSSAELWKYGESGVVIDGCTFENIPQKDRVYKFNYNGTRWYVDVDESSSAPGKNNNDLPYVVCTTEADNAEKAITYVRSLLNPGEEINIVFPKGNTATGNIRISINGGTPIRVQKGGRQLTGRQINWLTDKIYKFVFDGSYLQLEEYKPKYKIVLGNSHNLSLAPGIFYQFTGTAITTLNVSSTSNYVNEEISFEFNSGSTPTVFTYPLAWKWANGTAPTINANKTYHVSVVNNCAVIAEF